MIVLLARNIQMLVEGEPYGVLADGRFHEPRLPGVHLETFLESNGTGLDVEALNPASPVETAGKKEIIRIARVDGARGSRQAREAKIEPPGT